MRRALFKSVRTLNRFLVVIYKQILRSGEKCKRKFKKTPFVIMNELMEFEILLDNVDE